MSPAAILTRRAAIAGSSAAMGAIAGVRPAAAALPRLKDLAAHIGLRFGSDSDTLISAAPAAYADIMAAQCDVFAPNLSWRRVASVPGSAEPAWVDPNVGFARQHEMALTGAHLLWYQTVPAWFASLETGPPAWRATQQHVAQLMRRCNGQVFSWNVVNEEIDTRTGDADGMRQSILLDKLGPAFIADAFHLAAATNSGALLTYNDTHFEMDTATEAVRRTALLKLLDRLQQAGAPITAVGLQSHLRLDGSRFDPALYRRFLHDIASRGLRILITELDVSDIAMVGSVEQRDHAVAAMYRAFLDAALDETAVAQVVVWGLSDRYTWLTPDSDPSYRRPDGSPARPLPFDDAFQPKPAFAAIAAALRAAPVRRLV